MVKKNFTSIYCSLSVEDDVYIDELRVKMVKDDKKHYTKTEVVTQLIHLGMAVVNGQYLKLDPNIDKFVAQMQEMIIEMNGEKIVIKKSKEQVYNMIIEKGLQNLDR